MALSSSQAPQPDDTDDTDDMGDAMPCHARSAPWFAKVLPGLHHGTRISARVGWSISTRLVALTTHNPLMVPGIGMDTW